eukprot:5986356-Amphidinium_carterae.5
MTRARSGDDGTNSEPNLSVHALFFLLQVFVWDFSLGKAANAEDELPFSSLCSGGTPTWHHNP